MYADHLIGSPLALADTEYAKKTWIKFQDLPGLATPQVNFLHGSISNVDCATRTAILIDCTTKIATTHSYDYFVAATGLRRAWPVVPQSLTRKQYLLEAEEHIHAVSHAQHGVVVVGGGAVGIEMAAELKTVKPHLRVTLVHSRDRLLSSEGLSEECKGKALELLREAGVEVLLSHRLLATTKVSGSEIDGDVASAEYKIDFTNGKSMRASVVIMAVSNSVSTAGKYLPSSALDEKGYVHIRSKCVQRLHSLRHPPSLFSLFVLKKTISQQSQPRNTNPLHVAPCSPLELPMQNSTSAPVISPNGLASSAAAGRCTRGTMPRIISISLSCRDIRDRSPRLWNSMRLLP